MNHRKTGRRLNRTSSHIKAFKRYEFGFIKTWPN